MDPRQEPRAEEQETASGLESLKVPGPGTPRRRGPFAAREYLREQQAEHEAMARSFEGTNTEDQRFHENVARLFAELELLVNEDASFGGGAAGGVVYMVFAVAEHLQDTIDDPYRRSLGLVSVATYINSCRASLPITR